MFVEEREVLILDTKRVCSMPKETEDKQMVECVRISSEVRPISEGV